MSANVFKYCWVSTETQDPRSARLASIKMGMHSTSMLASFILQQEVTTVSEKIQKLKFSQVLSLIGCFRLSWVSLIVRVCKSQVQARLQHEIQISGVGSYHFVTL